MTTPTLPVPIPSPLETPPLTTGNIQQDMPLLINWFWRAYQVISQSVAYINSQVTNPAFSVANLPNPASTTLAQAQTTANNAYNLANTANVEANNNAAAIATINGEIITLNNEHTTDAANIATNTAAIAANGIPPHSMRVVVWDGTGQAASNGEIAQVIWDTKQKE